MLFESEKTLFFSWERRRMIDKTRKSMFKKNSEPELLIIKIRSDRNSDPGPKSVISDDSFPKQIQNCNYLAQCLRKNKAYTPETIFS